MKRAAIAFGLAVANVPAAFAGTAGVLPPLEIDYGGATISTPDGNVQAQQMLIGFSWASLYPKATPIDLGFGLVCTFADEPKRVLRGVSEQSVPSSSATGAFVSFAVRVAEQKHLRWWLGGRWEALSVDGSSLGGVVRGSVELWRPAIWRGGGTRSGVMGTIALGIWGEVGARTHRDESIASMAAGGVSVRVPFIVAY